MSEISRKKIGEENEDVRDFVSLFGSPAADLPVAVKNINLFECRTEFASG